MKRLRKWLLPASLVAILLCLLLTAASIWSNQSLPAAPEVLDRLDKLDKARLAESLQLKERFGDDIWPGFAGAQIPILLWNHSYSFLVNYPGMPAGWEIVPGDQFQGKEYYRRPTSDPQNFAVEIDGVWVASMATKWETDQFLFGVFRDMLPSPLDKVFPYRFLIQPSEVQITGVLHESFHVFQAQLAARRLEEAEAAHRFGDQYWAVDLKMHPEWKSEMEQLASGLQAGSNAEAAETMRQFLAIRGQRRTENDLSSQQIRYEKQLEWEEGLAKYVEIVFWRAAHEALPQYQPLPELAADPDFKGYRSYDQRISQVILEMRRQSTREGETRLYNSGMAQAFLLDRLLPGWKSRAFQKDVFLDDLLEEVASK